MIDVHAHILPGLDDGARDLDEAIEMCRIASRDGIETIVATPHTGNGAYDTSPDRIVAAVADLRERLEERNIAVGIVPGADAYIHERLDRLVLERRVMTVNDNMRYVMVEFPSQAVPPNYAEWIFRLTVAGLTPVLTHPERNIAIWRRLHIVHGWVEKGGLVQITAMSLTGGFGPEIRKCAEELLKRRLVHIIASDAHSAHARPPLLSGAARVAASFVGAAYARKLVEDHPAAIIRGAAVDIPEPASGEKKRFFFWRVRP